MEVKVLESLTEDQMGSSTNDPSNVQMWALIVSQELIALVLSNSAFAALCWLLKISYSGSDYTMEISKCYKSRIFFFPESRCTRIPLIRLELTFTIKCAPLGPEEGCGVRKPGVAWSESPRSFTTSWPGHCDSQALEPDIQAATRGGVWKKASGQWATVQLGYVRSNWRSAGPWGGEKGKHMGEGMADPNRSRRFPATSNLRRLNSGFLSLLDPCPAWKIWTGHVTKVISNSACFLNSELQSLIGAPRTNGRAGAARAVSARRSSAGRSLSSPARSPAASAAFPGSGTAARERSPAQPASRASGCPRPTATA
ncbi:uncharacterized protein LOC125929036 [Panthera uncia]|uniref:uncharacterized protein LOC125929036 n=1 Tax=Panthera uncia TaxID=29064 RepID=UPI0020FFA4F9|nr:uncharacterized protein LOC125929036 [Panthera uncia]